MEHTFRMDSSWLSTLAAASLLAASAVSSAQGVLTVTPGRSSTTITGNGVVGYTGDGGAATSATVAKPSAVAYDKAGDLFIADANNHVVREVVASNGTIVTVAGTGTEGFSGDGGSATAALLDAPTGVAVDANGNVFIADSHNHCIRKVSGGLITTVAGTGGTKGFSGDGGAAISATLDLPSGVAVDATGNIYIADTNNQRIRKVSGTTINTIAGNGIQGYTGDGGAATSATLDSPTGVAVDANGNVYIADRNNQRVREIFGGTISTFAGNGTPTFAGGFAGDGAASAAASLAKPMGISVDADGNVYIADTNNQRVRQVSNGAIASIIGTGVQGAGGDGGIATSATLNSPKAVAPDAFGNLAVADTLDQRVRGGILPTLAFGVNPIGSPSTGQPVKLANTGTASITVSSTVFTGAFETVTGGTCSATPITLAAGASCTTEVAFLPTTLGAAAGSVVFSGSGVTSQTILLTGTGNQASTTTTLTASSLAALLGQNITFTATVQSAGSGVPTGTVTFYSNGVALGTPQTLTNGSVSLVSSFATVGTFTINAIYTPGSTASLSSTSNSLAEVVGDFGFALTSSSNDPTVTAGNVATFGLTVTPLGYLPFVVTFSTSGLPQGSGVTFTPSTASLAGGPTAVTMAVQTPSDLVMNRGIEGFGGPTLAFALLLAPFVWRKRRSYRKLNAVFTCLLALGTLTSLAMLSGCGDGKVPRSSYSFTVTATATGPGGQTLTRSTQATFTAIAH